MCVRVTDATILNIQPNWSIGPVQFSTQRQKTLYWDMFGQPQKFYQNLVQPRMFIFRALDDSSKGPEFIKSLIIENPARDCASVIATQKYTFHLFNFQCSVFLKQVCGFISALFMIFATQYCSWATRWRSGQCRRLWVRFRALGLLMWTLHVFLGSQEFTYSPETSM